MAEMQSFEDQTVTLKAQLAAGTATLVEDKSSNKWEGV